MLGYLRIENTALVVVLGAIMRKILFIFFEKSYRYFSMLNLLHVIIFV